MDKIDHFAWFIGAIILGVIFGAFVTYDGQNKCIIQNETQLSNFAYNTCLQGCFNAVQNISGEINQTNQTQKNIFVGCGNICMEQYENMSQVRE